jgi:hypothetical protein
MRRRLARMLLAGAVLAGGPTAVARQQRRPATRPAAAPQPPPAAGPVSREEYERLRNEVAELRRELGEARRDREQQAKETDESLDEIDKTVAELKTDAKSREGGTANFLLSGNATISYFDRENDDSTLSVVFRPLFVWKLSDRLLFEAKPEIRLRQGTEDVSVTLEYADLSYVVHDAVIVGAGKFLTPFGLFPDRFYPGKLLEEPLVYQRGNTGLVPHSEVGAFARGAFPVGDRCEANYAVYVGNGPSLRSQDPARPGLLDVGGNFRDTNDNKAVGARVGFLPFPALEVGASIYHARVDPDGFERTTATLYGVDLQYVDTIKAVGGVIDARAEWAWSDVEDATYDPTGALGFGPLNFDNRRNGGYVEVGYRPSLLDNRFLRDCEFVARYDFLETPAGVPGPADEQRVTVALLYWVTATTAVSAGYIIAEPEEGPDRDTFYLRASVGF